MTSKQFDVVCVGIATWDTLLTGISKDLMEIDGILATDYLACSGGDAVNAAINMAPLGTSVTLCALLGEDTAGDMVINELKNNGVDTTYLTRKTDVHTSSPVLLVDEQGERHIIRVPQNGNQYFTKDMISEEVLHKSSHLHFASANMLHRLDGKPLGELFRKAHTLGLTTSMDASYDRNGKWMQNIEDALQNCDIFIPSLQEASVYARTDNLDEICNFFSKYPLQCFGIKLGEKGVLLTDFKETIQLDTLYKGKPVDTTGAGDAFLAGFVAAWLRGYDMESCGYFGSAQSYSVLQAPGASVSAGGLSDAMELLKRNGIQLKKRDAYETQ